MATSTGKYSRAQIILHWTTLVLLLVSFFSHEAMKDAWRALRRGTEGFEPGIGVPVHVWIGVAILVLTLIRLVLRLTQGAPAPVPGQPRLATLAAAALHGALYLLLLAIPASGIAAWFLGVTDAGDMHEVFFNIAWVLVAGHVLMALYHQFVMKDNLIARVR